MLATSVQQSDCLDPASDGLRCRQQLDARAAFPVFGDLSDLIQVDHRNHAPLVIDVAHESRCVGEDQQPLSLECGGKLHRQAVAVDVDRDTLMADRRRRDNRQVAGFQQQAQQLRIDPLDGSTVIVMKDLRFLAFFDPDVRLAPPRYEAAVHRRQPNGIGPQRSQPFNDALVLLAGVGHQKMVHRRRVGKARDLATLRRNHPRRMPETAAQLVQLFVGAVDKDQRFLAGGDVVEQWVEIRQAAADLDDEHA